MKVNKIRLINFRNFLTLSTDFTSSINIFIGANAQGKTNIIESIYTLLRGSSYRTSDEYSLINWNENSTYILGAVQGKEEKFQVNIQIRATEQTDFNKNKIKKIIKVNKKYKKKSWLIKKFCPVIFTPEDLQIVKSSPSLRRKFLNEIIINLNPLYYQYLTTYNRILFQRNKLLKEGKNDSKIKSQLLFWDQKLIETGSNIILLRINYLQRINQKIKTIHPIITNSEEIVKLKYQSNILKQYTNEKDEIIRLFEQKLNQAREEDLKFRVTTIGPHRDDFLIMNESVNLGIYGSQGQQRTVILSLKLVEIELYKENENNFPPLLLDDVMSELDEERETLLLQLIKEKKMQTFITSINLLDLNRKYLDHADIFKVEKGLIQKI